MVLVKTAISSRKRKKRWLKLAKGHKQQKHKRYRQARRSVQKGMQYAYRDRKVHTRLIRRLWIARINAACRLHGIIYSRFMKGLADAKIEINRKILAELAVNSPDAFKKLVDLAKESMAVKSATKSK